MNPSTPEAGSRPASQPEANVESNVESQPASQAAPDAEPRAEPHADPHTDAQRERPAPDLRAVFEDLQRRAAELLRSSPAADLERNLRALLAQGFDRLDLVSRNEIEQSLDMIAALHKRVDALEQQLRALSGSDPTPPTGR